MSEEDALHPIAVYIGTHSTAFGLAEPGNSTIFVEHSFVTHPRTALPGMPQEAPYAGERAWAHRSIGKVSIPLENGSLRPGKSEDYSVLLKHAYTEVGRYLDEPMPLFLVERDLKDTTTRKLAAELAFESLEAPSFAFAHRSLMSLHAVGLREALVLHMGSASCDAYPILSGKVNLDAVRSLAVAGQAISQNFQKKLSEAGFALTGSQSVFEQIDEAKKDLCYIPEDLKLETDAASATPGIFQKNWTIAASTTVTVGAPRFQAAEVLFDPSLANCDQPGLPELVAQAIKETNFFKLPPIVLSGGSSLLPGLSKRICKEISSSIHGQQITIIEAEPRESLQLKGAQKFASDKEQFDKWAVTKSEYQECGHSCLDNPKHSISL